MEIKELISIVSSLKVGITFGILFFLIVILEILYKKEVISGRYLSRRYVWYGIFMIFCFTIFPSNRVPANIKTYLGMSLAVLSVFLIGGETLWKSVVNIIKSRIGKNKDDKK